MADPELAITIAKTFRFEAAHSFAHEAEGHPFTRLHGHSFEGVVTLEGDPDARAGFVVDFWRIETVLKEALAGFDHGYLNDIADLETPSLENIAATLFRRLAPRLPGLVSVEIRRPSCGESALARRAQPP